MEAIRWIPAGFAVLYVVWKLKWMAGRSHGDGDIVVGKWTTYAFFVSFFLNLLLSAVEGYSRGGAVPVLSLAGAALIVLRVIFLRGATRTLGTQDSYFISTGPDHVLVRCGPYAWCRHPMYASRIMIAVGLPLVFGAWWCLAVFPVLDGIIIYFRIKEEEISLLSRLGEEYKRYREEVSALIPVPPALSNLGALKRNK